MDDAEARALAQMLITGHEEYEDGVERLFTGLGTPDRILALAGELWADPDVAPQILGFDLLARQALTFTWHVPALIAAADRLDLATAPQELRLAAARALAEICDDPRVLRPLLRFAADPDPEIRWQVARGIPVGVDPLPEQAVEVMLSLVADPQPRVRDWATMVLGARSNDSLPIRDAFAARLHDDEPEADIAGEAAVALARRKDPRVLPVLLEQLADPHVGNLYVEAAEELANPALLPLLHQLKTGGWQADDSRPQALDAAIRACISAGEQGHIAGEHGERTPTEPPRSPDDNGI
ncbi:HEAT repeat domain-containing protein [Actinomadura kijaniata]|uniref:HEAT repeat domain-containing protein n=1 Tax=Actinomadura kijaniata TaxID=46161 RepID=UPI003F1B813D